MATLAAWSGWRASACSVWPASRGSRRGPAERADRRRGRRDDDGADRHHADGHDPDRHHAHDADGARAPDDRSGRDDRRTGRRRPDGRAGARRRREALRPLVPARDLEGLVEARDARAARCPSAGRQGGRGRAPRPTSSRPSRSRSRSTTACCDGFSRSSDATRCASRSATTLKLVHLAPVWTSSDSGSPAARGRRVLRPPARAPQARARPVRAAVRGDAARRRPRRPRQGDRHPPRLERAAALRGREAQAGVPRRDRAARRTRRRSVATRSSTCSATRGGTRRRPRRGRRARSPCRRARATRSGRAGWGISAPLVGIHGTPDAASIGYSASHGCIRMLIPQVEWLFERVEIGTPVFIVPA